MKKNINGYIFENKKTVFSLIIVIVMMAIFAPLKSFILKWLIDAQNVGQAIMALGLGCCIILCNFGFNMLGNNLFSLIQTKSVNYIRSCIVENIIKKNNQLNYRSADYLSVLTNDIQIVSTEYFEAGYNIIQFGALLISALIMYVMIDVSMLLFVVIAGISSVTIPRVLDHKLEEARKNYSIQISNYTVESKELFGGFEIIKNFLVGEYYLNKYRKQTDAVQKIDYNLKKTINYSSGISSLVGNILFFLVMLFGMLLVFDNKITLGYMVAATNLSNFVVAPCQMISANIAKVKSCKRIIGKINSLMDYEESDDGDEIIEGRISDISFENIRFGYSEGVNSDVLKNVTMCINDNNNKIAIIGESGGGKSTITKLLYKYFDNYSGCIKINGCDIRKIERRNLYQKIGYLSQNPYIFNDTIRNNITLHEDFLQGAVEGIIQKVKLDDLVSALPNGLDTIIDENGANLSGGQIQRIALARVLIRDYDCVVADEITASLDPTLSDEIMNLILDSGKLVIAITHDIQNSFIYKFTTIYELKDGLLMKGSI